LEIQVKILTLDTPSTISRKLHFIFGAQTQLSLLACSFWTTAFANDSASLSLQATTRQAVEGNNPLSAFTSWLFGISCVLILSVFVATLWPRKNDANLIQKQRKFARVDGLFLNISGVVLSSIESSEMTSMEPDAQEARIKKMIRHSEAIQKLTLLSLSMGGCSVAVRGKLTKGDVILMKMGALPDFPSTEIVLAAKSVWVHSNTETGETYDVCGAKFLNLDRAEHKEALAQYLNFLMDEPLS
jgi:hypothetical protein